MIIHLKRVGQGVIFSSSSNCCKNGSRFILSVMLPIYSYFPKRPLKKLKFHLAFNWVVMMSYSEITLPTVRAISLCFSVHPHEGRLAAFGRRRKCTVQPNLKSTQHEIHSGIILSSRVDSSFNCTKKPGICMFI